MSGLTMPDGRLPVKMATANRLPGRGTDNGTRNSAGLLDLAAEVATLPTPALAEQLALLVDAPAPLAAVSWPRLQVIGRELAARLTAPPRRLSAAEAGARLVEAVEQQAPPDQRWAARSTCLSLELIDYRGHATRAGRKALARLEAAS